MGFGLSKRIDLEIGNIPENEPKWFADLIILIIKLRRNINVSQNFEAFDKIVKYEIGYIIKNTSDRWVNSIVDTYVDHGDKTCKAQALVLSQFICNLHVIKLSMCNKCGIQTNGSLAIGNKYSNLFSRIDDVLDLKPISTIWKKYKNDLMQNNTAWKHLAKHSIVCLYHRVSDIYDIPLLLNSRGNKRVLIIGKINPNFLLSLINQPGILNIIVTENHNIVDRFDNVKLFKGKCENLKNLDSVVIFGDAILNVNLDALIPKIKDLLVGEKAKDLISKRNPDEFHLRPFLNMNGWIYKPHVT